MSVASEWNVAVAFKRLGASDTASCVGVPHAVFHFVAPSLYSHYGHCEIVLRTPSGTLGDRVPEVTGATHHGELVNTVYTIDRTRPVHTRTDPRPYYQDDTLTTPWTVCCFTATPRELTRLHEFLEAQVMDKVHLSAHPRLWSVFCLIFFRTTHRLSCVKKGRQAVSSSRSGMGGDLGGTFLYALGFVYLYSIDAQELVSLYGDCSRTE